MIKNIFILFVYTYLLFPLAASAQQIELLLWPNGAPGTEGKNSVERIRIVNGEYVISNIHKPSVTVYLPGKERSKHVAVIIVPGGGHRELWITHEGYNVAKQLCKKGIAAVVLKYRLAKDSNSTYTVDKDEMADVQRALRLVRYNAEQWDIDTSKIGVMGFSAGGELAGLSAMRFDSGNLSDKDLINHQGSRPAFQALIYPGNAERLEPVKDMPPVFLLAGYNDNAAGNITELFLRYRAAGIPAELHIYSNAGHGFGIRESNKEPIAGWVNLFCDWLAERGIL